MNGSRKQMALLALPLAGALIPLCLWQYITVPPSLTPGEKDLLACTPVKAELLRTVTQTVSGVACPIPRTPPPSAVGKSPAAYPPVPLNALVPRGGGGAVNVPLPEPVHHLSLVLLDEGRKLAIVNGRVLREGETVGAYRVSRIEKNRVKLKGLKGELWVNLE